MPIANLVRLCLAVAWAQSAAPAAPRAVPVRPGIDVFMSRSWPELRGKRIGLITNAAAVTSALEPTVDALARHPDVTLAVLMGPEHGLRGAAWAGESVKNGSDPKTKLPVYSLYGGSATAKPTAEMLSGVDLLIYDIPDIGVRSYTYPATLALAMEAAAEAGKPLWVLDRPDPLGGLRVEGNTPPPNWEKSLVNWLRVPYVYGLTPGELARMINGEGWLGGSRRCELKVIPLKGWSRRMLFAQTGLPWVPTSPHVPKSESPYFVAATGILGELKVLNNGVGTPLPFELVGAPWIDPELLAQNLNSRKLPGVHFRSLSYKPFYAVYQSTMCHGVQVHFLKPAQAPWVAVQLYVLDALRAIHPDHPVFSEASADAKRAFDKVLGTPKLREDLEKGRPVDDILAEWKADIAAFERARRKYLLYP